MAATNTQPRQAGSGEAWEGIFKSTQDRMRASEPTAGGGFPGAAPVGTGYVRPLASEQAMADFYARLDANPMAAWGRMGGRNQEEAEPPPFDPEPNRYSLAQAGMTSPDTAMAFQGTLPPQMQPMAAAEAEQINEMNRRRQMWFDQWKQLMAQTYGQYAQNLGSGRGLFA